jgi:hypothetical protein
VRKKLILGVLVVCVSATVIFLWQSEDRRRATLRRDAPDEPVLALEADVQTPPAAETEPSPADPASTSRETPAQDATLHVSPGLIAGRVRLADGGLPIGATVALEGHLGTDGGRARRTSSRGSTDSRRNSPTSRRTSSTCD